MKATGLLPPLNSTPLFRHPEKWPAALDRGGSQNGRANNLIAGQAEKSPNFGRPFLVLGPSLCRSAKSPLSFFSLMFLFPWCFLAAKIPWSFGVFSAYFPRFLRVRKVRQILGVFEVLLDIFRKDQRKEGQRSTLRWS